MCRLGWEEQNGRMDRCLANAACTKGEVRALSCAIQKSTQRGSDFTVRPDTSHAWWCTPMILKLRRWGLPKSLSQNKQTKKSLMKEQSGGW